MTRAQSSWIVRTIVLGFFTFALWFGFNIWRTVSAGRQRLADNVEVRAVVLELIPERGRPLTKHMRLSDGTVPYVPDSAVPRVHVGDSVLQKRGQNFYLFVGGGSRQRLRVPFDY